MDWPRIPRPIRILIADARRRCGRDQRRSGPRGSRASRSGSVSLCSVHRGCRYGPTVRAEHRCKCSRMMDCHVRRLHTSALSDALFCMDIFLLTALSPLKYPWPLSRRPLRSEARRDAPPMRIASCHDWSRDGTLVRRCRRGAGLVGVSTDRVAFDVVPVTLGDQSPRLGSTSPSSINPCCRF
jgi:hypothetical protein